MIYSCSSDLNDSSDIWSEAQDILLKALANNKLFLYDENQTYGVESIIVTNSGHINVCLCKEKGGSENAR